MHRTRSIEMVPPQAGSAPTSPGRMEKNDVIMKDESTITLSPNESAPSPPEPQKPAVVTSKVRLIALTICLSGASFLNTLSVQAAVIVLPTISRDLKIPAARQQWVVSAYSLTFACFLLLWARLADVYGRRNIFIGGSAGVMVSTLLVPFMPNEISFDIFRGLQGLGAAANTPTAIGILGATFPPGKSKTYAISTYSAGFPLGSVIGNLLGGLVGQYASWRWIFWILAILGGLVTVGGYFIIPHVPAPKREADPRYAVDWLGGVLITCGLIALMFALTEGNVVGWSTPWIPVLIVIAVILIVAFVFWQQFLEQRPYRNQPPLMKVSIWRNYRFSSAQLIMLFFFACFNNYLIYATYFYQDYQGLSVIQTTLRFIPTGVVGLATAFASSQILSRINGNHILIFGTTCTAIACLLFAVPFPPHTTYWAYGFPAMCLSVFGADTVYPCLILFTVQSLPPQDQAIGGGIVNAVGQLGRSIGLAIAVALQTSVTRNDAGGRNAEALLLYGYRSVEYFNFALGVIAIAIAAIAFRGAGKVAKPGKK